MQWYISNVCFCWICAVPLLRVSLVPRSVSNQLAQISPISATSLNGSALTSSIIDSYQQSVQSSPARVSGVDDADEIELWVVIDNLGTHNAFQVSVRLDLNAGVRHCRADATAEAFFFGSPSSVTRAEAVGNWRTGYVLATIPAASSGSNSLIMSTRVCIDGLSSGSIANVTTTVPYYTVDPSDPSNASPGVITNSTIVIETAVATPHNFSVTPLTVHDSAPRSTLYGHLLMPGEEAEVEFLVRVPEGRTRAAEVSFEISPQTRFRSTSSQSCPNGVLVQYFWPSDTNLVLTTTSPSPDHSWPTGIPLRNTSLFGNSFFTAWISGCIENDRLTPRNVRFYMNVDSSASLYISNQGYFIGGGNNRVVDITLPSNSCTTFSIRWDNGNGNAASLNWFWSDMNSDWSNTPTYSSVPSRVFRHSCNWTEPVSVTSISAVVPSTMTVGSRSQTESRFTFTDLFNPADSVNTNDFLHFIIKVRSALHNQSPDTRVSSHVLLRFATISDNQNAYNTTMAAPIRLADGRLQLLPHTVTNTALRISTAPLPVEPGAVVPQSWTAGASEWKCAQAQYGTQIDLTCDEGFVIAEIGMMILGPVQPVCRFGAMSVREDVRAGACFDSDIAKARFEPGCVNRPTCAVGINWGLGYPCGGRTPSWATVSYRCSLAPGTVYDVSMSVQTDSSVFRTVPTSSAVNWSRVNDTYTAATIPVLAFNQTVGLSLNMTVRDDIEMGAITRATAMVSYRRAPFLPRETQQYTNMYLMSVPVLLDQYLESAKIVFRVLSWTPRRFLFSAGEQLTWVYLISFTSGSAQDVEFSLENTSQAPWVNITSVNFAFGANVQAEMHPNQTSAWSMFSSSTTARQVSARLGRITASSLLSPSTAADRSQWTIKITVQASHVNSLGAMGGLMSYVMRLGNSKWSTGFQLYLQLDTGIPQVVMQCQSKSRWKPGVYYELFSQDNGRSPSGIPWSSNWNLVSPVRWGAEYRFLAPSIGDYYDFFSPKVSVFEEYNTRMRTCWMNNGVTLRTVDLGIIMDNYGSVMIGNKSVMVEFDTWYSRNVTGAVLQPGCNRVIVEHYEGGGTSNNMVAFMSTMRPVSLEDGSDLRAYLPAFAGEQAQCEIMLRSNWPPDSIISNASFVFNVNDLARAGLQVDRNSLWVSDPTNAAVNNTLSSPTITLSARELNHNRLLAASLMFDARLNETLQGGATIPLVGTVSWSNGASSRPVNTITAESAEPLVSIDYVSSTRTNMTRRSAFGPRSWEAFEVRDNSSAAVNALAAAETETGISPGFFAPNPTPSTFNLMSATSRALPWSFAVFTQRRSTDTAPGLGDRRFAGAATQLSQLVDGLYRTMVLVPAGDHTASTPFIRAVSPPVDLTTRRTAIPGWFEVQWPENLDPEVRFLYTPIVRVMGYGSVVVNLRSNTAPVTITPLVMQGTQDVPVTVTLPASDRQDNKIKFRILSVTGNVTLNAVLPPANPPLRLNTWETLSSLSFTVTPARLWYGQAIITYDVSDGCKGSIVSTIRIPFARVNVPPVARSFVIDALEDSEANPISFASFVSDTFDPPSNLSIVIATVPARGKLLLLPRNTTITPGTVLSYSEASSRVVYTPDPLFWGNDTFSWRARDSDQALSTLATVDLRVTHVNHRPNLRLSVNPVISNYTGLGATKTFTLELLDVDTGDLVMVFLAGVGSGVNAPRNHTIQMTQPCCSVVLSSSTPVGTKVLLSNITSNGPLFASSLEFTWRMSADSNLIETDDFIFVLVAMDNTGALSQPLAVRLRVSGNIPPEDWTSIPDRTVQLLEDGESDAFTLRAYDPDELDWNLGYSLVLTRAPAQGIVRFVHQQQQQQQQTLALNVLYNAQEYGSRNEQLRDNIWSWQLQYVPRKYYSGVDFIEYQFVDSREGKTSTARITFDIEHVNHAPEVRVANTVLYVMADQVATLNSFTVTEHDEMDLIQLELLSLPTGELSAVSSMSSVFTTPGVVIPYSYDSSAWALYYRPQMYVCSEDNITPTTSFKYRVCDNSGMENPCSAELTVSLVVRCVNHPPYAQVENPLLVTLPQLAFSEVPIAANDYDAFDPIDRLNVTIMDFDVSQSNASFWLDVNQTKPLTRSAVISYPHRIYVTVPQYSYYKDPFTRSELNRVAFQPWFTYSVVDQGGLRSAAIYRVNIRSERVNQPPQYRGATTMTTDQNQPLNMFLGLRSLVTDDGLALNKTVAIYISRIPVRGKFLMCDASDICGEVDKSRDVADPITGRLRGLFLLTHPAARCVFVPDKNTYAQNYGLGFELVLLDSEGLESRYPITLNVRRVDQAPWMSLLESRNSPLEDGNVVSTFEDSSAIVRWRVFDVDSEGPGSFTSRITNKPSRRSFKVYACAPDLQVASSVEEYLGMTDMCHVPVNATPLFTHQTSVSSAITIPAYATVSSTCSYQPGYPVTNFALCFAEFRVKIVPGENLYSPLFTQFSVFPADGQSLLASFPTAVYIQVLPVNDPPTMEVPFTSLTANTGARVVSLSDVMSMNESMRYITVDDKDALASSVEFLVFNASGAAGPGYFDVSALRNSSISCGNDYSEGYAVMTCNGTLKQLNAMLRQVAWVAENVTFEQDRVDILSVTIDDDGNIGVNNEPKYRITKQFSVLFGLIARVEVAQTSNALFISIAVAAVAALVIGGLLIWKFHKKLDAPAETYFQMAVTSISIAPQNPLYKSSVIEHTNKLYEARNYVANQGNEEDSSSSSSE
jgi:hypothetical protein